MDTLEKVPPEESKDIESSLARYEYDPWLLDDHPLRSHPTECIPGLGSFIGEWYISIQKRWKETLLRAGCLLLACLAAFHVLGALLSPAGQLSRPASVSRHSSRGWQVACTFPHSDPRPSALAQSVAAGCEGFRTDLWLHDNELLIGVFGSGSKAASDLHVHLDSLLTRLEPRASSAGSQIALSAETPDHVENDPHRTFVLVLDVKSRFHEIYPRLVSQLDTLRQRGYLSHWDGAEIVRRPVTIVVSGESVPRSDCSSYSYADVFWSSSGGDISQDGVTNDSLSAICAV